MEIATREISMETLMEIQMRDYRTVTKMET